MWHAGNLLANVKAVNAIHGCRSCSVSKKDLSNPQPDAAPRTDADIRRTVQELRDLQQSGTKLELEQRCRETGAVPDPNPFIDTPHLCLDLVHQIPIDAGLHVAPGAAKKILSMIVLSFAAGLCICCAFVNLKKI